MAELLLEILCEEIPARMQVKAAADLDKLLSDALSKAGLDAKDVRTFSGPRRLTYVAEVPLKSPDVSEERKGPRVGAPEQALAGFLRGAGLDSIDQAEVRSDKKGEHYVALIEKPGRDASDIIAQAVVDVMGKFPWPKSMKSGTTTFRWVRPLQSILCLLDGKIVPFEVNGFQSANMTSGHRRMGRGPFTVDSFKNYQNVLMQQGRVILDADIREQTILKDAKAVCKKAGLELVEDIGLLKEVAGLAEWPTVILGDMDEAFLKLPPEVIKLSMRTHQKYFAVRDPKSGDLAPHFAVVANQVAPDGGKAIAQGNSRVLSARLDDARFFEQEDAKRTLESRFDDLDGVVFHEKLGTIKDKSQRVMALARELAPKVGADPDQAELAAKLAKCDLVTNTVVEFTSLQGQIGRLMYEREHSLTSAHPDESRGPSDDDGVDPGVRRDERNGEAVFSLDDHRNIALAIEEHYKPQGPSDNVPTNPVSVAVALADKLDTLVGFWAIDEKPTGSKDPFALRRAALGVVRIILESDLSSGLRNLIHRKHLRMWQIIVHKIPISNIRDFNPKNFDGMPLSFNEIIDCVETTGLQNDKFRVEFNINEAIGNVLNPSFSRVENLLSFILDRLKVYLRDEGYAHDHIDAVFALGGDDLVDITNRIKALAAFLSTDDGVNLLAGYKRAANILRAEAKKDDLPDAKPGKGTQAEETALFDAIQTAAPKIEVALAAEQYADAMTALAGLRKPIDAFFDEVTVNSDDAAERVNRLALLMQVKALAGQIADFDKVEGA